MNLIKGIVPSANVIFIMVLSPKTPASLANSGNPNPRSRIFLKPRKSLSSCPGSTSFPGISLKLKRCLTKRSSCTRLIEILKAIAAEQGKMEKLVASQAGKGSNKKLMDALADLKRKANVNISRSDSILKKLK